VVLVERKRFPREKTCGDGLTPRSVRQLEDMGLGEELTGFHRYDGLRAIAFGRELELAWPDHPDLPAHGYVVTRHDLDHLVAGGAQKAGADLLERTEATEPIFADDRARGAVVATREHGRTREIRARYVVVSDGANSRFGRALGASRDRSLALGMALRGYYRSPRHDEPWIESHLDLRDRTGQVLPGYGWIFPLGDGRVNVGVGLLSTSDRWSGVNTTDLMAAFVDTAPRSWELSPATSCGSPTGGRLPMGLSVGPRSGPGYLVTGDAAGAINPFNGEGIAYAYETGRLAALAVGEALATGSDGALGGYESELQNRYGLYYRVAQAFVKLIGQPKLMRSLVGTGMHSRTLMEWVLRIMANILRPDELGPAEAAYQAVAALSRSA
jgi:geranylgeranyl reductase family protein